MRERQYVGKCCRVARWITTSSPDSLVFIFVYPKPMFHGDFTNESISARRFLTPVPVYSPVTGWPRFSRAFRLPRLRLDPASTRLLDSDWGAPCAN
jgi:hypothetical protein